MNLDDWHITYLVCIYIFYGFRVNGHVEHIIVIELCKNDKKRIMEEDFMFAFILKFNIDYTFDLFKIINF